VFILCKLCRDSVVFVGKAGVYQSETPFRSSTPGKAPGLAHKQWTRLERLARSKHSSLLQEFSTYSRKKFYNIGPWTLQGLSIIKNCECCFVAVWRTQQLLRWKLGHGQIQAVGRLVRINGMFFLTKWGIWQVPLGEIPRGAITIFFGEIYGCFILATTFRICF
jgi:hypothetical protein